MRWHHTPLDRRHFLQVGASFSAFTIAGMTATAAHADSPKDPFGGFQVGVQSYTFRTFDLEQALKRTKDLGLHYAELYQKHAPLQSTPEQIQALLRLCKEYEVTPRAFGVSPRHRNQMTR